MSNHLTVRTSQCSRCGEKIPPNALHYVIVNAAGIVRLCFGRMSEGEDGALMVDFDSFVYAMWILFLLQSSKPEPDLDGVYDLGTIESPRMEHQRLQRETPYSVCKGLR